MRYSLTRILARAGYEVLPVGEAGAALEILGNSLPVDVLVSDIGLPDMRGTQLVRQALTLSPLTVSVLITGDPFDPADIPDRVPVLRKPFPSQDLIAAVRDALARSKQLPRKLDRQ